MPFLFPTPDEPANEKLYAAFKRAVAAEIEAHAVRSAWVTAFAFDDEHHFEVVDGELRSWAKTSQAGENWRRNGHKMDLLHGYWFLRAFEEFAASDIGAEPLGTSETDIAKLLAHLRARRDLLQLNEIYGMDAAVLADSGVAVDLFVALRTLELLTSFFALEFAQPFLKHLEP